jgi:Acyl-protein synthetase, LuxE
MNKELSNFAARLRESIASGLQNENFDSLALKLFALQFENNFAYRKICEARKLTPKIIQHWTQIPFVPTSAFKELELTSLAPNERAAVFHSSGTTEQKPSRHFHCQESLQLYQNSLWSWFQQNVPTNLRSTIYDLRLQNQFAAAEKSAIGEVAVCKDQSAIFLTPPPKFAPNSSLVHMFETIRRKIGAPENVFVGKISDDGSWILDFDALLAALNPQSAIRNPQLILGTAFSFVHLLDFLAEKNLRFQLPENSRVMETGGYKNRSRAMPKAELHSLIEKFLGIPRENIICEYGMSELSSQAYDSEVRSQKPEVGKFQFPPWARAQIVSPETGREVADDETGLIRIFDLANVFSVAAIQTEDLGIRRGDGFELIGRAQSAEPRGCSLMTA